MAGAPSPNCLDIISGLRVKMNGERWNRIPVSTGDTPSSHVLVSKSEEEFLATPAPTNHYPARRNRHG